MLLSSAPKLEDAINVCHVCIIDNPPTATPLSQHTVVCSPHLQGIIDWWNLDDNFISHEKKITDNFLKQSTSILTCYDMRWTCGIKKDMVVSSRDYFIAFICVSVVVSLIHS